MVNAFRIRRFQINPDLLAIAHSTRPRGAGVVAQLRLFGHASDDRERPRNGRGTSAPAPREQGRERTDDAAVPAVTPAAAASHEIAGAGVGRAAGRRA